MFKLVVLSVLIAVAAARPSLLHGEYAVAAPAFAVPSAVSHQSRTDIVSSPVVATYTAPAVAVESHVAPSVAVEAYAAPYHVAYAAPAHVAYAALPAAVSSQYRHDVISKPVVAAYAAPAYAYAAPAYGYAAPSFYGHH